MWREEEEGKTGEYEFVRKGWQTREERERTDQRRSSRHVSVLLLMADEAGRDIGCDGGNDYLQGV